MGEKRMRVQSLLRGLKFGALCLWLVLSVMRPGHGSLVAGRAPAGERRRRSSRKVSRSGRRRPRRCSLKGAPRATARTGAGGTLAGKVSGAPDLTDRKWQEGVSEKRMTTSIVHGRGVMPPFADKLSQTEIASLVSHVRKFKE